MPDYEWDDQKNRRNNQKHGLDFNDAHHVFTDPDRTEYTSDRNGEPRWLTVGRAFGLLLTVVYTLRRAAIRIISFRRANRAERRDYLTQQNSSNDDV